MKSFCLQLDLLHQIFENFKKQLFINEKSLNRLKIYLPRQSSASTMLVNLKRNCKKLSKFGSDDFTMKGPSKT